MPPVGIDTNLFLRIFIDDHQPQHATAVELVRTHGQVFVGTVVMVEAVLALKSLYKFPKEKLVRFISTVLETDVFVHESRDVLERALFAYSGGSAGFADYVILESALTKGIRTFHTFDKKLARSPGVVGL